MFVVFADGFMKKTMEKKKETGEDSMVCRDGWWLVWLVITIASFWHEYVCKDTNVHCGRWEHFKIEKLKKKKDVDHINISWNLFFCPFFRPCLCGFSTMAPFRMLHTLLLLNYKLTSTGPEITTHTELGSVSDLSRTLRFWPAVTVNTAISPWAAHAHCQPGKSSYLLWWCSINLMPEPTVI